MDAVLRAVAALVLVCLITGEAKADAMPVEAFAQAYLERALKKQPDLKFEQIDTETYKVTGTNGLDVNVYVGNAYRDYRRDPGQLTAILDRHLAALLLGLKDNGAELTSDLIVPIVRTSDYLDAAAAQPGFDRNRYIVEPLVPGLVVLYAFDMPQTIRSVLSDDLERLKLKRGELRNLARDNLTRLYGDQLKPEGNDGFYFYAANVSYESSMLLMDVWTRENFPVRGEIVVFVPGRNHVIVTGSQDEEGLRIARRAAEKIVAEESYPMLTTPLVRRYGRWQVYKR